MDDLYAMTDFSGVELIAWSIGQRSFDLIVDVPNQISLSKAEMLRRFEKITDPIFRAVEGKRLKDGDEQAWARLQTRFADLSNFIKGVKQRAVHRYHRNHGTDGRLWGSRYTRVLLQPGHATRVLAAWMDHAGVREGTADAPENDRFSTFGRAVAGDKRARAMVAALFSPADESPTWRKVAKAYQDFVTDATIPPDAPPQRNGPPLITRPQFLRTEVPHFHGGVALGDRDFVESVFQLNRKEFGPNRTSGARRIFGQCDPHLWTLRHKGDLRKLRE